MSAVATTKGVNDREDRNRREQPFLVLRNSTDRNKAKREKCLFKLIPPKVQDSALADLIYKLGGDILEDSKDSEHAISILDEMFYFNNPDKDCVLPFDIFSSVYIHDVDRARQNKFPSPDLNEYHLTDSNFESYDANKILTRKLKWSDLKRLQHKGASPRASGAMSKLTARDVVQKLQNVCQNLSERRKKNEQKEKNKQVLQQQLSRNASESRTKHSSSKSQKNVNSGVNETDTDDETTDQDVQQVSLIRREILANQSSVREDESQMVKDNIQTRGKAQSNDSNVKRRLRPHVNGSHHNVTKRATTARSPSGNDSDRETDCDQNRSKRNASCPPPAEFPDGNGSDREAENQDSDDDFCTGRRTRQVESIHKTPSPSKRVASEKEKSKLTPIILAPHPGTSASIRRPINLVPRAVAGPSEARATTKARKSVKDQQSESQNKKIVDKDSSEESILYSDSDAESDASKVTGRTKRVFPYTSRKAPFSLMCGQEILDIICENNAFLYTKGIKLWKQLESAQIFPGRTYQSLKEHWRKKVLPNALNGKLYKISPENLKRLQKAQDRANWTKHSNFCPDFTF